MTEPTPSKKAAKPMTRRQAINLLGGAAGAVFLVGCNGDNTVDSTSSSNSSGGSGGGGSGSCTKVAEETNGPFPSDGSNTNNGVLKNVLTDSRVIRKDLRSDFDGTNTQAGTPLTLTLTVQNVNGSCALLSGFYVYLWHCNANGSYSQYSGAMNGGDFADRTFLRGVQVTNSSGQVTFTTNFPGRYSGRASHIHFEVYPADAGVGTSGHQKSKVIATSQLAFPAAVTDGSGSPYTNTALYPNSANNRTANESDNVFSDGTSTELLSVSGNNTEGYVGTLTLSVAA